MHHQGWKSEPPRDDGLARPGMGQLLNKNIVRTRQMRFAAIIFTILAGGVSGWIHYSNSMQVYSIQLGSREEAIRIIEDTPGMEVLSEITLGSFPAKGEIRVSWLGRRIVYRWVCPMEGLRNSYKKVPKFAVFHCKPRGRILHKIGNTRIPS